MNAHVIRIQGSAWRPRKGGSIMLSIMVQPDTQAQWVEALEMFASKPELSITVLAPKVASPPSTSSAVNIPQDLKVTMTTIKDTTAYDAIGPKADVDCPVPGCDLLFEHEEDHSAVAIVATPLLDCPKGNCGMTAGHKGKCVKKKVAK